MDDNLLTLTGSTPLKLFRLTLKIITLISVILLLIKLLEKFFRKPQKPHHCNHIPDRLVDALEESFGVKPSSQHLITSRNGTTVSFEDQAKKESNHLSIKVINVDHSRITLHTNSETFYSLCHNFKTKKTNSKLVFFLHIPNSFSCMRINTQNIIFEISTGHRNHPDDKLRLILNEMRQYYKEKSLDTLTATKSSLKESLRAIRKGIAPSSKVIAILIETFLAYDNSTDAYKYYFEGQHCFSNDVLDEAEKIQFNRFIRSLPKGVELDEAPFSDPEWGNILTASASSYRTLSQKLSDKLKTRLYDSNHQRLKNYFDSCQQDRKTATSTNQPYTEITAELESDTLTNTTPPAITEEEISSIQLDVVTSNEKNPRTRTKPYKKKKHTRKERAPNQGNPQCDQDEDKGTYGSISSTEVRTPSQKNTDFFKPPKEDNQAYRLYNELTITLYRNDSYCSAYFLNPMFVTLNAKTSQIQIEVLKKLLNYLERNIRIRSQGSNFWDWYESGAQKAPNSSFDIHDVNFFLPLIFIYNFCQQSEKNDEYNGSFSVLVNRVNGYIQKWKKCIEARREILERAQCRKTHLDAEESKSEATTQKSVNEIGENEPKQASHETKLFHEAFVREVLKDGPGSQQAHNGFRQR